MSFSESIDDVVAENHNRLLSAHSTWERVRLDNAVAVLNGFAFPSAHFSKSKGTPLIRIRDVLRGKTETLFAAEFDDSYLVEKGDLVVGMDGDFNSRRWAGRTALLNQRVCKLTPKEQYYNQQFLAYALPGYLAAINARTSAITVKHLSSRTVQEIPLPLPPINEQRRIVAKLDELFSRLDAGVAALEAARAKLKRLRASVLKSAVEGRLTADWREANPDVEPASELLKRILVERRTRQIEAKLAKWRARKEKAGWTTDKIAVAEPTERDKLATKYKEPKPPETDDLPELPATWCWTTVDAVSWFVTKGSSPKWQGFDYVDNGVPFVRSQNVRDGLLDLSELAYLDEGFRELHPLNVIRPGDVLANLVGASIGRAAVATLEIDGACMNQAVGVIRLVSPGLDPRILVLHLTSPHGKRHILKTAADVARANFNLDDVKPTPVPLAPVHEQVQITSRVDEHLSRIDAAEKAIDAGLARSKRLRQSILKRAFEGKLVPQDPTDEPASLLLERIRVEREAADIKAKANGKPRGKKKPKKATAKPAVSDSELRHPRSAIAEKQLSLLGDDPKATTPIDPAKIAEAFRQTHDGWSTDYVVVCPDANARFLDAASRLGIDAPAVAINKELLNIRKTVKAELPKATHRHRVDKELAPFEFVSEWSIRIVQRQLKKELGREPSLDTIFCDPELAQRFDEIAARLKNKFSPLDYRWTALKLRKLQRGKASDLIEFGEPLDLEAAVATAPEGPGAYQVLAGERPLYVGSACDLRSQLLTHGLLAGSAERVLPAWVVGPRSSGQLVCLATRASEAGLAATRRALAPTFNHLPI